MHVVAVAVVPVVALDVGFPDFWFSTCLAFRKSESYDFKTSGFQDYNCLVLVDRYLEHDDATVPRTCTPDILTIIPRREDGKTWEVFGAL